MLSSRIASLLLLVAMLTPVPVLAQVTPQVTRHVIAQAVTVKDAAGRNVEVGSSERIVSIGGSITEILYELGADQRIVAVDSTSQFPSRALTEKKNVGYMRALSPEGVLGVAPTLILAMQGSGPPQTLSVLESAGVPMVTVGDEHSGEGILRKIHLVAKAVRLDDRGQCLAGRVSRDLERLAQWRTAIARPLRVVFVLSFVNGRAMVAGRKTAADGIIRMAGAINAVDQFEGYKQLEDESVVAAQPDAVLAMVRSGAEPLTAKEVFGHPGFALSPAASRNAFVAMDGLYLLGFGPRTAAAARDLARKLYPDLQAPQTVGATATPPTVSCDR
jgi:iron complex transport system substrate-binding protein